jgi:hypothetical protein
MCYIATAIPLHLDMHNTDFDANAVGASKPSKEIGNVALNQLRPAAKIPKLDFSRHFC